MRSQTRWRACSSESATTSADHALTPSSPARTCQVIRNASLTVLPPDDATGGRARLGQEARERSGGSSSSRRRDAAVISSTASSKARWLAAEGRWMPLTLRTNCSAAASISSGGAAPSGSRSRLMLRHTHERYPAPDLAGPVSAAGQRAPEPAAGRRPAGPLDAQPDAPDRGQADRVLGGAAGRRQRRPPAPEQPAQLEQQPSQADRRPARRQRVEELQLHGAPGVEPACHTAPA